MNTLYLALIITVIATIFGAVGSLLLKIGSNKFKFDIIALITNYTLIIGLSFYVLASILFIFALKYTELSYLYPFISLSYIWTAILSIKYLNEEMNKWKWIAIIIIIIGVSFIGFGSQ
jgi:drug/metabolite transporter (DMT)-like permease